jgi:NAD+ synthase (glutamine-hydrolysing)
MLQSSLVKLLKKYRKERAFDTTTYIEQKATKLNNYMQASNLKTCVVAVSGGIDSAVVLGLVHCASKLPRSPIQAIIPLFLPVFNDEAATNQSSARDKVHELCETFEVTMREVDITSLHALAKQTIDGVMNMQGGAWASGQLVAYLRTPTMYYVTSLCSEVGQPAIICGTTNYDEGGYLGYFGKASDGMVDVQLISDAHKSEVNHLAKVLGIPASIINAIPTGDMYDGRPDEELFGTSYDFVELYTYYLNLTASEQQKAKLALDEAGRAQFNTLAARLEKLHAYNHHKYLGKSPAVHLDIVKSSVMGGWNNERI